MKGMKRWAAFFVALTLLVSAGISALAAPEPGEDYTFDELARFIEYYNDDFYENRGIWEMEDGDSMDPRDIPEGQEFISKAYMDAFREKSDELWAVGESGEEAVEEFDREENRDARRELYQALKACVEAVENNMMTGTRPAALDSLSEKLRNAWDSVNDLMNRYGDVEDTESSARNVHVVWMDEGETVDDEFINEMNAKIPDGHYWIPGDDWMYFWQSTEAMDWVFETLNSCDTKLNEAEASGNWDSLDGMAELIDKAAGRVREMRRFLEAHLYPRPEPGNQETPSQSDEGSGQSGNKQEETVPERTANQVKGSDGKSVVSTLAGVYSARTVNGVAVITQKEQAEAAAGLQTPGSRLSMYTSEVSGNNELRNVMSEAAGLLGAKTAGVFQVDLYSIEGNRVNALRNIQAPVRLVIELPRDMLKANGIFSILVPDGNGGVLEMTDLDQDPATITIDAVIFGMWTIIYR